MPNPTWGNHVPLAESVGIKVERYRYFDKKTVGLDFEGMKEDIKVSGDFLYSINTVTDVDLERRIRLYCMFLAVCILLID